jgi:WD40 repeat protein
MWHNRAVCAVGFSADGRTFLTLERSFDDLSEKGEDVVRLWDAAMSRRSGNPIQYRYLWKTAFSPSGSVLMTWGGDSRYRLWNAVTGREQGELFRFPEEGKEISIGDAAFSPDGKLIVTVGATLKTPTYSVDYHELRLWNPVTGKPLGQPAKLPGTTWHVTFSPDGKRILTGSDDKTARYRYPA